jgi:CheY-like chemotaxis protein
MFEERRDIEGDLTVASDTRLYGVVAGDVVVTNGALLVVHGTIRGSLRVEERSRAHVYGAILGDVVTTDAELRVWKTAIVRGTLHRGAETQIERGARVSALVPPATPSTVMHEATTLSGFHVLLVEDDEATLERLAMLLSEVGANVSRAVDGAAAVTVFLRERPNLIVSDLWMPETNGYDFISRVRKLPPEEGGLTPAIAMTAASADSEEKALMAGFHAYLAKPFTPDAFLEVVRAFHDTEWAVAGDLHGPRWALRAAEGGAAVLTFREHVRASDVRDGVGALARRLAVAPAAVIVDALEVTGFELGVGTAAERAIWAQRRRLERVTIVSHDARVRLVAAAACFAIGVPCSATDELPREAYPR